MRPRLFWRMVIMNVMSTIEYRAAFLVYMINVVATPLISLLVWLTLAEQGVALPYDRGQFVTYYVLLSVVSMLTSTWLAPFVAQAIRLGGLSVYLLWPAPYIAHFAGNNLGEKIVKLPLLLPLVALVALVFRADIRLPAEPRGWLLFALALPLAAAVAFLLDFVIGSLAFWMQDVSGLVRVKNLVGAFLAGQIVPLALFPPQLAGFLEAQPFRYTLSFPLELLTGSMTPAEIGRGFAWQAGYCVGLWACYRLLWRYGLRSYAAAGA
ncbi:MAG TPA: ABC-2 family transporter protein [Roseiflexaceae bacterium]|nr:ABC-2 family transporter protein [Roseiflexaceae bacterium]